MENFVLKIDDNKIVKFKQSFRTASLGYWGSFEREVMFPKDLEQPLIDAMRGKIHRSEFSVYFPFLDKTIYDPSLVFKVPVERFNGIDKIAKGMAFNTGSWLGIFNTGQGINGIVVDVNKSTVSIDCNYPYIGQKNIFSQILILDVRDPLPGESLASFKSTIRVRE